MWMKYSRVSQAFGNRYGKEAEGAFLSVWGWPRKFKLFATWRHFSLRKSEKGDFRRIEFFSEGELFEFPYKGVSLMRSVTTPCFSATFYFPQKKQQQKSCYCLCFCLPLGVLFFPVHWVWKVEMSRCSFFIHDFHRHMLDSFLFCPRLNGSCLKCCKLLQVHKSVNERCTLT